MYEMTNKSDVPISYAERLFIACRIATGAMSREIPEKPIDGRCGRCVRASGKPTKFFPGLEKNWNYCPICGQQINWDIDGEMRIPGEWEDK